MKKFIFSISLILFLSLALSASADIVGEKRSFFIEPSYDLSEREEINVILVKTTPNLYFYVDESWWNFTSQNEIYQALSELGQEFEENIYPVLTSVFGPEWNPGIDKDSKITVLIHPMADEAGGYFSTKDEYSKIQISNSNEREMLYLNSEHIGSSLAKSFLAHEFVHLITFNQKENTFNAVEEIWLNEARAEYASTLIGYDNEYLGSNLEKRVEIFSNNSRNSIVDWKNQKEDYGVINLFIQYLVDHYGIEVLVDSLQSSKTGIESINYVLKKNGYEEDFSQIFLDWTIAVLINDCNYGNKYCYLNNNLKNNTFASPRTNFLPLTGETTLSITDTTRSWTGNWYKIIGGQGDLKLEFSSSSADYFTIPYITKDRSGNYIIDFLEINSSGKAEINIEDFNKDIISLYIIPIVNKPDNELFYSFSWSVSTENHQEEKGLISMLLRQINLLTAEIARIQSKINAILARNGSSGQQDSRLNQKCRTIENNLRYGMMDNEEVRCLQQFLSSQGPDIYPEKLVTGNFLSLTKSAVIRFQEKYTSEILTPWGIEKGTGYVGKTTREKINKLLAP